MVADLSRVSTTMQDVAGIVGRLPETSGDEDNEEKCKFPFHLNCYCILLVYFSTKKSLNLEYSCLGWCCCWTLLTQSVVDTVQISYP